MKSGAVPILAILAVCLLQSASCRLDLRTEVDMNDLFKDSHLNSLLANTLNTMQSKRQRDMRVEETVQGGPTQPQNGPEFLYLSDAYKLSLFDASKAQAQQVKKFLASKMNLNYHMASRELERLVQANQDERWLTFVLLQPVGKGLFTTNTCLVHWDADMPHFTVYHVEGQKTHLGGMTKKHVFKYTSLFGYHADETELITPKKNIHTLFAETLATEALLEAYQVVAQARGVDPRNPSSEVKFRNFYGLQKKGLGAIIETIILASMIVKTAARVYEMFAKLFGTSVTEQTIGEYRSNGFKHYAMGARLIRLEGVKPEKIMPFSEHIVNIVLPQADERQKKKAQAMVLNAQISDEQNVLFDEVFVNPSQANNKDKFYANIINKHQGKMNFFLLNTEATFQLAPNLLVHKRTTAKLGGFWGTDTETLLEEVPQTVTHNDLEVMRIFNVCLALKLFSDDLGNTGAEALNFPVFP